ncbi:MAG: hypothetical protein AAF489_08495 [Bacteroidota bacterium]
MQTEFKKAAGFSLIIGAVLMTLTMVLHPSGGSIEHILNIKNTIIVSHAIAILSLPFLTFGFYGMSLTLMTKSRVSLLAFISACFGLFAVMIAATINGLTLPLFLSNYPANEVNITAISAIRHYGSSINIPMDYIFIVSIALSMAVWSILIIKQSIYSKWIGYYGILLIAVFLVFVFSTFSFVSLHGFRFLIFGLVSWVITIGVSMMVKAKESNN